METLLHFSHSLVNPKLPQNKGCKDSDVSLAPQQRRAKLDVGREVVVRAMTNTYTVLCIHQTCSKVLPVVQLIDSSQPHKVGATLPLHFTDEDLEHREVK